MDRRFVVLGFVFCWLVGCASETPPMGSEPPPMADAGAPAPDDDGGAATDDAGTAPDASDPVAPPRTTGFDDAYAAWEGDDAFWFGLRMDDVAEIDAQTRSGFGWDPTYHALDAEAGATVFLFTEGEKGLPHSGQIRPSFEEIGPHNAQMATFVWECQYDERGYGTYGGKAFQISNDSQLHVEIQHQSNKQAEGEPTWLTLPSIRTYGPNLVGGNGEGEQLSSDEWRARNVQPPLDAPARNHEYLATDHVGVGGRAFLIRPNQWHRYVVTLDWRSHPHRIHMWMASEDTELTKTMADPDDPSQGFILEFDEGEEAIGSFWFEFNNSRAINPTDAENPCRSFFVLKDVLGSEI